MFKVELSAREAGMTVCKYARKREREREKNQQKILEDSL